MGGAKNCPETPRQKMIGMMYLVLTAMLALNVSTDILNGFTLVDDSLHSSIEASVTRNEKLYRDFKEATDQNPEKMQEWYDDAIELKHRADSLWNYIQDFKTQIAILADGQKKVAEREQLTGDGARNIEGNSNLDVTAQYAIVQGARLLRLGSGNLRRYACWCQHHYSDQDAERRTYYRERDDPVPYGSY